MTDEDREIVRRLVEVYSCEPADRDVDAWNAHAADAEQELPWREDPALAVRMQEQAWREARVRW